MKINLAENDHIFDMQFKGVTYLVRVPVSVSNNNKYSTEMNDSGG